MQNRNFLLFIALTFLFFALWMKLRMPTRPAAQPEAKTEVHEPAKKSPAEQTAARADSLAVRAVAGPWAGLKKSAPPAARPAVSRVPSPAPPTPADKLLTLGDADPKSPFHLRVVLDPRGAGVRSVLLNKFQEADAMGHPEWKDKATGVYAPLELVPDRANRDIASDVLYHFRDPDDPRPMDTLGRAAWTAGPVEELRTEDGSQSQRVTFQTEVQGVRIAKTFTLMEGDYHLGLEVTLTRLPSETAPRKFRYQLAGAHGLPIEGRWYTSTFRNALIGRAAKSSDVKRDVQTLAEISRWEGGKEILKEPGYPIRYAAVAVQYFTAAIVVDHQDNPDFLKQARPTLETAVARGELKKVDRDRATLVLAVSDRDERTFHLADDPKLRDQLLLLQEELRRIQEGGRQERIRLAVVYHTTGQPETAGSRYDLAVATRIGPEMSIQPLWEDDITVRVSTETLDLKPGEPVTHRYMLYNGPVKPSLLADQVGAAAVPPATVHRYTDDLYTLTDYPSSGLGTFFNKVGWVDLIIWFTNRMHWLLNLLHKVIPSLGVCIIVLTILVRGVMFPLSRKQALMSLKMQELAPEMKKIQEKYKDDPQGRTQAQMELYRRHKINPMGSCWLLLLQMPIFMGLYFALQESIQFRLAPFWPTWIQNLAAPDMLVYWSEKIPWISRPEDYGGILYLGPYFNLLPVIAVALMILQQKLMTPPATNEEEATRNAMMKYMMIFIGVMFYKVASGLCLYFVASSLWGFAERKLLPKKKASPQVESADSLLQRVIGAAAPASTTAVTDGAGRGGKSRRRAERARPERGRREEGTSTLGRLRAWWSEVLKQAEKK